MKQILLLSLSLIFIVGCSEDKPNEADAQGEQGEQGEQEEDKQVVSGQYMKAYQLVKAAQAHLAAGQADSASIQFTKAEQISEAGSPIRDKISNQVKELNKAMSVEFRTETLGGLSAQGLKSLKAGDKSVFFADPSLNTYFIKQLKAHAGEWAKAHSQYLRTHAQERKERIAAEMREEKKDEMEVQQQIGQRRSYAKVLRNSFLDNNLDIKVDVSGKNATHLTLKYVLFSAVWVRKLETGGFIAGSSLDQWHEMGFAKISLTDGYDYSASFTF